MVVGCFGCFGSVVSFYLSVLLLPPVLAGSWTFDLPRYTEQCFSERLANGDRLEISFEVFTGGKIDCVVTNPDTSVLHTINHESSSAFGFYGGSPGSFID
jgi:hypothetical protein